MRWVAAIPLERDLTDLPLKSPPVSLGARNPLSYAFWERIYVPIVTVPQIGIVDQIPVIVAFITVWIKRTLLSRRVRKTPSAQACAANDCSQVDWYTR